MMQRLRSALIYAASLGASIGAFFLIRSFGPSQVASGPQGPARLTTSETPGILLHVLLTLVVVLVVARILGAMFRRLNQPQVMGEVVAGHAQVRSRDACG